jgi:hypothetical protein
VKTILTVAALATAGAAQSLIATVNVTANVVVAAGPQVLTQSLFPGPLFLNGQILVQTPAQPAYALSSLTWWSDQSSTGLALDVAQNCQLGSGATSAASGPFDVRVDLAAPTNTEVTLELTKLLITSAGLPAPVLRVDIGNDGTFEFTETSMPSVQAVLTLGPTRVPVRIVMDMAITQTGVAHSHLWLRVLPYTYMSVTSYVAGCSDYQYAALPTFGGDLQCAPSAPATLLSVAVFGLGTQPVLLGGTYRGPCVLLPTPDLVVFAPASSPVTLTIPQAARPITIWTQGVLLEPVGLTTTPAYRVQAW